MQTHLVTGGAGFVGSHLCEYLLNRGCQVISLDNLSTGSINNIEHLRTQFPKSFTHHTSDLENGSLIAELVDRSDVIYHLAAVVGVKKVLRQTTHALEVNLGGTGMVLKHAAKKGKRVLIASTSEVYGKGGNNGPLSEASDLVLGPSHIVRWNYAVSKLADEHLALAYFRDYHLPVTIFRLFNTVGPRQVGDYGMVLPRFIRAALEGQPIEVYGTGEQARCFCYISDSVRAIVGLASEEKAIGEVFNIGNPREITIKGLANMVKTQLSSSSTITHTPYTEAYGTGFEEMARRVPAVLKIKNIIGWVPEIDLEEIISLTAEWTRQQKS